MHTTSVLGTAADSGSVLVTLLLAFAAAKLAGEVAERLRLPSLLGELGAGIVLGPSVLDRIDPGELLLFLAELGVIVLLFQVGLETSPSDLRAVGSHAATVAVLGVLLPFAGGITLALATGHAAAESAFVATTLVATSVGITARALTDLGAIIRPESRVIMGAALIDDVLGLLVLAVVAGAASATLSTGRVAILVAEALGFVGAVAVLGPPIMGRLSGALEAPRIRRAPFSIAIVILLGLSAAAERVGLAAIVGAFLAGTILSGTRERPMLARQFEPVGDLLTPFFFVVTGARIRVQSFADPEVLAFAAAITVIAVAGKVAAGVAGARALGRPAARVVGWGMVPRGEVGIIVAGLGLEQGIVGRDVFGATVAMIVVTTVMAPLVLPRLLRRAEAAERSEPG